LRQNEGQAVTAPHRTPEALSEQNDRQAEKIKALWYRVTAQQARIDKQQGMIDWLRRRVETLEAELTPQAIAERYFDGS
tara:strand:+ start:294 stop:530 length:237 start_codon:yes stop_codon:yes gene_type:complete